MLARTEPVNTIDPPLPCFFICAACALRQKNCAFRLVSMIVFHSGSSSVSREPMPVAPALLKAVETAVKRHIIDDGGDTVPLSYYDHHLLDQEPRADGVSRSHASVAFFLPARLFT